MGCGVLMRARLWRFISGVGDEAGPLLAGKHIHRLACLEHPYILSLLAGLLLVVAHICWLACLEHAYILSLSAGSLVAVAHICWLACLEHQYILSLLAGLLIVGTHMLAGMLGACIYFIPVSWTTHSSVGCGWVFGCKSTDMCPAFTSE